LNSGGADPSATAPMTEVRDVPKRELIEVGTSKRYIRRDERGRFTADQSVVGRSLAVDRLDQSDDRREEGSGRPGRSAPAMNRRLRPPLRVGMAGPAVA
jgi:hypothetical protein